MIIGFHKQLQILCKCSKNAVIASHESRRPCVAQPSAARLLARSCAHTGAAIRSPCTDRFYGSTQKLTAFGIRISGLALSICAARCLRKRKRLPNRCGRLTPPQAALPCGPRRFAPRNNSIGWNPVIKIRVLTKTDRHNRNLLAFIPMTQ